MIRYRNQIRLTGAEREWLYALTEVDPLLFRLQTVDEYNDFIDACTRRLDPADPEDLWVYHHLLAAKIHANS